jgi:hypothetical protein
MKIGNAFYILCIGLLCCATHPVWAADATHEVNSIDEQHAPAATMHPEIQSLITALSQTFTEHDNPELLAYQLTQILLQTISQALDHHTCAIDEYNPDEPLKRAITKQTEQQQQQQPTTHQTPAKEEPKMAEIILAECAGMATNFATILAAPKNPHIVGHGIVSMFAGVIRIISHVTKRGGTPIDYAALAHTIRSQLGVTQLR